MSLHSIIQNVSLYIRPENDFKTLFIPQFDYTRSIVIFRQFQPGSDLVLRKLCERKNNTI